MNCPTCGRLIAPGQASCEGCGAALPAAAPGVGPDDERPLYRFGPMGVGVSFSRPGLFVVTQQNCTEIVATNAGVCGVRAMPKFAFARHGKHAGGKVFSVPWRDVIKLQRADYLLNAALWIRYRLGDAVKDVGISTGVFWRQHIGALEEVARRQTGRQPASGS